MSTAHCTCPPLPTNWPSSSTRTRISVYTAAAPSPPPFSLCAAQPSPPSSSSHIVPLSLFLLSLRLLSSAAALSLSLSLSVFLRRRSLIRCTKGALSPQPILAAREPHRLPSAAAAPWSTLAALGRPRSTHLPLSAAAHAIQRRHMQQQRLAAIVSWGRKRPRGGKTRVTLRQHVASAAPSTAFLLLSLSHGDQSRLWTQQLHGHVPQLARTVDRKRKKRREEKNKAEAANTPSLHR